MDRVIVITGASSGIGQAVAERAARRGAAVVLSARRADRLTGIARAINDAGGRALAVPGDVTREADMIALVGAAAETFGRVDVAIANAGIGFHDTFARTPGDVLRQLVETNLLGTLYLARAAAAAFAAQGHGHFIAVSSIVGRRAVAGSTAYAATKAAQIGLVEGLRAEWLGTRCHASIVYPVSTRTEFRAAIARDYGQEVHGTGPQQSAGEVADAILACIESPRPEVYPYGRSKLLAVAAVVAPGLTDRLVRKYARSAR